MVSVISALPPLPALGLAPRSQPPPRRCPTSFAPQNPSFAGWLGNNFSPNPSFVGRHAKCRAHERNVKGEGLGTASQDGGHLDGQRGQFRSFGSMSNATEQSLPATAIAFGNLSAVSLQSGGQIYTARFHFETYRRFAQQRVITSEIWSSAGLSQSIKQAVRRERRSMLKGPHSGRRVADCGLNGRSVHRKRLRSLWDRPYGRRSGGPGRTT